jgi:coproporphyrinogen III oxidase
VALREKGRWIGGGDLPPMFSIEQQIATFYKCCAMFDIQKSGMASYCDFKVELIKIEQLV